VKSIFRRRAPLAPCQINHLHTLKLVALLVGSGWGASAPGQLVVPAAAELGPPLFTEGQTVTSRTPLAPKTSTTQIYTHGDPTAAEQLMLELVNRARANPTAEAARLGIDLNQGLPAGTISASPKPPLALNSNLTAAARAHSQWMLDTDTFSHTGADGSDPGERMVEAGYVFSGAWSYGENIAWRGIGPPGTPDLYEYTIVMHTNLFKSAGHRVNLCSEVLDEIGIGIRQGTFYNAGTPWNAVMGTQTFARSDSTPEPLLVGVVYRDNNTNDFPDPGEGVSGIMVQPAEGGWQTFTSATGGYAVPYQGWGSQTVVFSGGPLAAPHTMTFDGTGFNVKADLDLREVIVFVPGSVSYTPQQGFRASVAGVAGIRVSLQTSTNLTQWTTLSTYTLSNTPVTVGASPSSSRAYYRLLKLN